MIGLSYGNFQSGAGFDPDAQAFITAIGADATIGGYINTMFLGMKGTGTTNGTNFYSKLYAVYPMSPSDASTINDTTTKFNAVNPLDTDASFRITWTNTPLFSLSLGVGQNGSSNAFGNTHFIENANMVAGNNGATFSTDGNITVGDYVFGGSTEFGARTIYTGVSTLEGRSGSVAQRIATQGAGVFSQSRRAATDFEVYLNGVSQSISATSSIVQSSKNQYLLALNNGSAAAHFQGYIKFFAFHDGLTDAETQDFYDVINTWHTNLGR
jgi:hypothetical protein